MERSGGSSDEGVDYRYSEAIAREDAVPRFKSNSRMEAVEETVLLRVEQSGPPVGWSISQLLIVLTGGDLSLMTRLNLVRVWRDGSFAFIGFLVAIWLFAGLSGTSSGASTGVSINLLQAGSWPIAIIALNWCYYERGNLWIAVVGGKSLATYFKGLMLSLMVIGFGITAVILGVMTAAGQSLGVRDVAFMVVSLVGDSVVATMLLTKIRVKPGAFSAGLLVVMFVTLMSGAVFGFSASLLVDVLVGTSAFMITVQMAATIVFAAAVALVGFLVLDRLARGFEFS